MIGLLDLVFWLGHGLYFPLLSIEDMTAQLSYELYRIARFSGSEKVFPTSGRPVYFSLQVRCGGLSVNVSLTILLLYYGHHVSAVPTSRGSEITLVPCTLEWPNDC